MSHVNELQNFYLVCFFFFYPFFFRLALSGKHLREYVNGVSSGRESGSKISGRREYMQRKTRNVHTSDRRIGDNYGSIGLRGKTIARADRAKSGVRLSSTLGGGECLENTLSTRSNYQNTLSSLLFSVFGEFFK